MSLNARQQKALELLRANNRRDLYQTCHLFDYAITYTADEEYDYLDRSEVEGLVAQGFIVPKWPDYPKVQCWTLTQS